MTVLRVRTSIMARGVALAATLGAVVLAMPRPTIGAPLQVAQGAFGDPRKGPPSPAPQRTPGANAQGQQLNQQRRPGGFGPMTK